MKKLPQRIWVDQDSCWTEKPQGDGYTEYVHESYHVQALFHVLHKGVEQGKRGMLEDNIKWLKAHINDYLVHGRDIDLMFDDLRKAMEEQL